MKNAIKLLICALVTCVTAFIFTACGGGEAHTHDYTADTQVVSATCQNEGYTKHVCSCGDFIVDNQTPSTVHALDNDRNCTTCSKKASTGLMIVSNELKSLSTCTDTEIIIPKDVTSIYNGAFKNKTKITAIYIPKTVTEINKEAFLGCTNLKKVVFEDQTQIALIGADVFKDCSSLEYLEINGGLYLGTATDPVVFMGLKDKNSVSVSVVDGTKIINQKALYNSETLEEVSLPNSLVTICEGAFLFSKKITKSTFRGSYNEWAGINFVDSYSTPAYYSGSLIADGLDGDTLDVSTETINDYAFTNLINLKKIILRDSVKTVGKNSFTGCYNVLELSIGTGLESIGEKAFEKCYKLIEICNNSNLNLQSGSLENGNISTYAKNIYKSNSGASKLSKFGDYIIFNDNGYKTIVDYDSLNPIATLPTFDVGNYALYNKSYVTELIIPEGVKIIGDYSFAGLSQITVINIPNSLELIGNYTFEGCSKVEAINFGTERKLQYIGNHAFEGLIAIKSVILPDGLKKTGDYSFQNCTAMTEFSMPSSLEEVAWQILNGCKSLPYIFFRGVGMINDQGRSLHEIAQHTFNNEGRSYYFWWYYDCGTSYVKYPDSLGSIGTFWIEIKGRN